MNIYTFTQPLLWCFLKVSQKLPSRSCSKKGWVMGWEHLGTEGEVMAGEDKILSQKKLLGFICPVLAALYLSWVGDWVPLRNLKTETNFRHLLIILDHRHSPIDQVVSATRKAPFKQCLNTSWNLEAETTWPRIWIFRQISGMFRIWKQRVIFGTYRHFTMTRTKTKSKTKTKTKTMTMSWQLRTVAMFCKTRPRPAGPR